MVNYLFPTQRLGCLLDLEDPSRALMQVALLDPADGIGALAFAFPFPMEREEGEWRIDLPFLAIALDESCPFVQGSDQQAPERRDRGGPVNEVMLDPRRLLPPPGVTIRGGD